MKQLAAQLPDVITKITEENTAYESALDMNSEQYEKAFLDAILKEESI